MDIKLRNILSTLVYADIFDYPLTLSEVWRFLISDTEVTVEVVQAFLISADSKRIFADSSTISGKISNGICADGGFYFLKGREKIVETRKRRAEWSEGKLKIAKAIADKLKFLPTIKMIGVTGALAMENCEAGADIDLMVITAADRLWLTRLILFLLVPLLGIKRRKPKEREVKDKICFNLFLEENNLKIQPENLFLAHEICQVKPLLNKNKTYEKFLWENQWVGEYLPNAVIFINVAMQQCNNRSFIASLLDCFIVFLENLAFKVQCLYMKPKITRERVSRYQAFFHPVDLSDKIQKELERRIQSQLS